MSVTTKTENTRSFTIVPIIPTDKDVVIEFLLKFFYRDEPLNISMELMKEKDHLLGHIECHFTKLMDNGLAFKAISPNGDIVGIVLNSLTVRSDNNEEKIEDKNEPEDNTKFKTIGTFLDKVEREADVFTKYPNVERLIDIKIISVDESCRGQGICKALIDKTKELALENECGMVYVECSSYYSAKAAERLGFECIYTLYFRDYVDENGEVIFKTPPPHDSSKVYVLNL